MQNIAGVAAITSFLSANIYYCEKLSLRTGLGQTRRLLSRSKGLVDGFRAEQNDTSIPLPQEKTFYFFETSNDFMGIGPAQVAPGDVICQFLDCSAAFVLRPANSDLSGRSMIIGSALVFNKSGGGDDVPSELATFQDWAREAWSRGINMPFSSPLYAELPSYYSEGVGLDKENPGVTTNKPGIRLHLDIFTLQKLTRYNVYDSSSFFA